MQELTHELPGLTMRVRGRIPTCIIPSYWARHSLTREDIDTIISYVPTSVLWKCAILHGITPSWYSLRSSSSSSTAISLSGKAIAVDSLLEHLHISPSTGPNRLDTESIDSLEHIPPIPKYHVEKDIYQKLYSNISSQLLPASLMIPGDIIGTIPFIYSFMDQLWVPVGIEGELICCNVVIKESEYKTCDIFNYGYTHLPKIGKYENDIYCLTDELILVGLAVDHHIDDSSDSR